MAMVITDSSSLVFVHLNLVVRITFSLSLTSNVMLVGLSKLAAIINFSKLIKIEYYDKAQKIG